MSKPVVFVLLLGISILAAGLFGMLHNQLSYSVGASYFQEFKFTQFELPTDQHSRWGAALVGWRASWWMGLALGLPVGLLGLVMIARPSTFLAAGIGAVGAVIFVALLAGMLGLFASMMGSTAWITSLAPAPQGVVDTEGFARAALMHSGTYIGALIGLPIAIFTVWRVARLERANMQAHKQGAIG